MLEKIKKFLEFASKNGLYFPAAYDWDKEGPSVSLLFSHVSNILALITIIGLAIKDIQLGAVAAIIYSVLMLTFYLMRRITRVSVDLDDRSVSLENNETEPSKGKETKSNEPK